MKAYYCLGYNDDETTKTTLPKVVILIRKSSCIFTFQLKFLDTLSYALESVVILDL